MKKLITSLAIVGLFAGSQAGMALDLSSLFASLGIKRSAPKITIPSFQLPKIPVNSGTSQSCKVTTTSVPGGTNVRICENNSCRVERVPAGQPINVRNCKLQR